MMPVSERFKAAMLTTHTPLWKAEVIDPTGSVIRALDIEPGTVDEDEEADIRHSCDLAVVDPTGDLRPVDMDDMLMPLGTRIRVSQGVRFDDGTEEWTELITSWEGRATARRGKDGRVLVPIMGNDRWSRLQRKSGRTVNLDAGLPMPTRIYDLARVIDPGISASLMESEFLAPRLVYAQDFDLAAEMLSMAKSIGAEVFVSRLDQLIVRPVPMRFGPAQWTFDDDTVEEADLVRDVDLIHNGVVVTGQHSSMSSPVRGEAWDMDPGSHTYRSGPLGENPKRLTSEKITSGEQARAAAVGRLEKEIGGAIEIDMEVWPPPAHLLVGDVVHVDLPDVAPPGDYVLSAMSIPVGTAEESASITVKKGVTPWLLG